MLESRWVCLQWRVSGGGEQDVWESTPEFAAWHHPGVREQYGGTTYSRSSCYDADRPCGAACWGFFLCQACAVTPPFSCPRCSASGRGCAEARISPVTSLSWLTFFAYIWYFTASVWTGYQTTWSVLNNVNSCRHIWLIERVRKAGNPPILLWDVAEEIQCSPVSEANLSLIQDDQEHIKAGPYLFIHF